MPTVLIVGGTRGLGAQLVKQYASSDRNRVFATSRHTAPFKGNPEFPDNVFWIPNIDVADEEAGFKIASRLSSDTCIDICIISAGYFGSETFDEPSFDKELQMYKTSAIGPVFLVHHLVKAGMFRKRGVGPNPKIILVSSEAGSIALRHGPNGGGNFGHHASKAALNMVGKLLSEDLKEKGIAVGLVHPGFMRTDMTKGVGYDKFWESGGAVYPQVAATSLIEFIETFDLDKTGQFWAPRGAADIGTAEAVLGSKDLPGPLQLPW
ncbi:oxidoreductase [Rhizodiscina lignyota]|uniref:Oxidoreductase n=1 Tax=Rhizodiscina lignyota TaxID=1504668 RepID=A0A9P4IE99_9PEZI|nr:oxidoreductase [Rhizodiscina lignyota]